MLINKAIETAAKAHDGQADKAGQPYIYHPLRVMLYAEGAENVKCAAALHDVMEDSDITEKALREMGFSEDIITALRLLTRREGQDYFEYVKNLKSNPIAKAVKLADLKDNMDMSRIKEPTERDLMRLEKYKKARALLEE